MYVQIKEWGNSQGIRLSKEILNMAGFSESEYIEIEAKEGEIILKKRNKRLSLEERAAKFGGKLEASQEIDYGQSVGREIW